MVLGIQEVYSNINKKDEIRMLSKIPKSGALLRWSTRNNILPFIWIKIMLLGLYGTYFLVVF